VNPDPTQGSEIRKTRRCLVYIINRLRQTVVIVPYSTAAQPNPPITVSVTCQGRPAVAIVDQIRAIARHRLRSKIEVASPQDLATIENALKKILQLS
jgi:mRNA interferase MazF